jgi:pimeloyl-ACP methyl ester carboxylesterase
MRRWVSRLDATMTPLLLAVLSAAPITMVRLPQGSEPLGAHADEAELAQQGLDYAVKLAMLPASRKPSLSRSLDAAYSELAAERGKFPTPAPGTIEGAQSAGGFDLVLVPPTAKERGDAAVIFLHGWGGNATLECWLAARAVAVDGVLTACPSTGLEGNWDSADGRAIVEQTRKYLEARGKKKLVLVGLSNGSVGAAKIAVRDESVWAGVACLEGASALPSKVPVLVVAAKADQLSSPANARAAAKGRSNVTLAELEGDHFAALEHRDELAKQLRTFVSGALK